MTERNSAEEEEDVGCCCQKNNNEHLKSWQVQLWTGRFWTGRFCIHKYSFEELAKATGDFSNNNRVGQGGSGQVYRGKLPNGKEVAIKRLQYNSDPDKQRMELLFEDEVKTISRTRHPNIVEVVGYCSEEADRLIVYEFFANNCLKSHLYVGRRQQKMVTAPIDWPTRMKIALGTAEGLAYLHVDRRASTENCKEIFDSKLPNNFEKNDMKKLIYSAASCVYKPAKLRPHMCELKY
ncbi:proline-rich receptor-like protein kinase PERK15 [Manihot esculenta]|uniref:proline-rich receptor-like protein kinase PERK15 n=1 Tax=Manihot esculenta TaxID=3983 RepID=UPI001CC5D75F|nr:proline-rich receptor-like protein kinase PERK15 [Manihot esculenta]